MAMKSWIYLLPLLAAIPLGCEHLDILRSQNPEPSSDEEFRTNIDTPLIGKMTTYAGLNRILLQNVGLVVGLDGTGGDPPPSVYRTRLLRQMRKRNVSDPNAILQSPNTALVVVRAYLPPLIEKRERFDVEVRLPGNSGATSLNGGWLLRTHLTEQAIVPGQGVLEGDSLAIAEGPILISTGQGDKASLAGVLRRGRVLGGGVYTDKDRHMAVYLRNDFRSVRNATRIANRIGKRFHHYNDHGLRIPLANAKTDQKVELMLHPRYKNNYPRYLQVIRNIALHETRVARRVRMKRLKEKLNTPITSESAALKLEAIGRDAIPTLKTGLKHPRLEVRFHAATALAYLGQSDGIGILAEAARREPAFRVFALAAMSAVDVAKTHIELRKLLDSSSAETRYGAFRALTTLDANDPFIRGTKLNDEFMLHVLETDGEPMVHLTQRRKSEIVLFGAEQRFRTPLVARAGNKIMVTASPGSETVTVSRYAVGQEDKRKNVSARIAEVIRTVAEFGASYPDVAQMLMQADSQSNLPGRLEIDALPQSGRVYERPTQRAGDHPDSQDQVGRSRMVPNLFDALDDDEDSRPPVMSTGDDSGQQSTEADETDRPEAESASQSPFEADSQSSEASGPFDLSRILGR